MTATTGNTTANYPKKPWPTLIILAILLPIVVLIMSPFLSNRVAYKHPPTSVTIIDQTDKLDPSSLQPRLEKINFLQPTDVVVVALADGNKDITLNDKILDFAREKHPELLSPDGRYWKNGYFIFAVDPDARQVGTYFGEDRSVHNSTQSNIQKASKDDFRDNKWNEGVEAAVIKASRNIGAPWYLDIMPLLILCAPFCLILGWCHYRKRETYKRQILYTEATTAWANVTRDYKKTELNASTIPASSTYGSCVLGQFKEFSATYHDLARQFLELGTPDKRFFRSSKNAITLQALHTSAQSLDTMDDTISNTAELLNMGPRWREAWQIETRPAMESLEKCDKLITESRNYSLKIRQPTLRPECTKLMETCTALRHTLDILRHDLEIQKASPEMALDALRDWMQILSAQCRDLVNVLVDQSTRSEEDRATLRENIAIQDNSYYNYSDSSSVSSDSSDSYRHTILGASGSYSLFAPASDLVTGYTSAVASTYSSGGDSGGDGGFSGSGSSSSF